jgi:hypothetical protein
MPALVVVPLRRPPTTYGRLLLPVRAMVPGVAPGAVFSTTATRTRVSGTPFFHVPTADADWEGI